MLQPFKFGPHARSWLVEVYKLDDRAVDNIEHAVGLDQLESRPIAPSKPPSRKTELMRRARQLEREARRL